MSATGSFVISLDFELMWGVRDKRTIGDYGRNILGGRKAIPAMLALFQERGIACTWATVGLLMCDSRDEILATLPTRKPDYRDRALSPYDGVSAIGRSEDDDPYHYGASLVDRIRQTPLQEIGTHTFSHFYCLEEGGDVDAFRADLAAVRTVAKRRGLALTSMVFPRNQYTEDHLNACREQGITAFRGNEDVWFHAARAGNGQTALMRGFRLADTYLPIAGALAPKPAHSAGLVNIASSRFLRPFAMPRLEPVRLRRITAAMTEAAQTGGVFHLWWHPHNFGLNSEDNLAFLSRILDHFGELSRRHRMRSMNMGQIAAETIDGSGGAAHQ